MSAASVYSHVIHAGVHLAETGLIDRATKIAQYTFNTQFPIDLPPVEAVIDSWNQGLLPDLKAFAACLNQGVTIPFGDALGKVRGWDEKYQAIGADWSSVVTAGQTALSLSDTMELFVREQLPEDLFMELMGRNKVV